MDARSGNVLAFRIAERKQWRSASAVREGKQAAADPDAGALRDIEDGVRRYSTAEGTDEAFEKRLVDGWWETVFTNRG
jgi:hypothetical protein